MAADAKAVSMRIKLEKKDGKDEEKDAPIVIDPTVLEKYKAAVKQPTFKRLPEDVSISFLMLYFTVMYLHLNPHLNLFN